MSQLFVSGGQSIGASASALVLPMNIQGWFPLGFMGLISLLSKGFSRVFPSTTVWKHQFFATQPFLWFNFHICIWLLEKKHSFDYKWVLANCLRCVRFGGTLWNIACQAPLSMGFSKQEYWTGLPCPPPGDLPNPGIKPHFLCLLHWQAGSLPLEPSGKSSLDYTDV